MSEPIFINLTSVPLMHSPTMMKYALNAFKTGDVPFAENLMENLIGEKVTKEGQLAILHGFVPLIIEDDQVRFQILPAWLKE
jgi:hypothetical protein